MPFQRLRKPAGLIVDIALKIFVIGVVAVILMNVLIFFLLTSG
jgi:hypothetical protein